MKTVTTTEDIPDWITDERFSVDYRPAIYIDDDGEERSIWPDKWSIDFLVSMRHTRSFALNFMNEPLGDGGFWSKDDITIRPSSAYRERSSRLTRP